MTRTRIIRTTCGIGLLGVALLLGASAVTVGAEGTTQASRSISFPLTTVVTGEPGTLHEVVAADVPPESVGLECSVTATAENNGSVHPDSDLVVTSGTDEVTVHDVEATRGATTTAEGTLTLASTITVSVRLGADGVFSGGGTVDLECVEVAPVTASTTTTTTTTPTPEAVVAAATESAPAFTG